MNKVRVIISILLLLLACVPCALAQGYKLGDVITNDDGSRGVVFYVNPDGSGGWMVALTDASTGCPWGTSADIPALANQNSSYSQQLLNDTDGYGNTEKIRAYQNNSTSYAAGKVDLAHGWYLPSAGQLRKLFGNLAKIEGAIAAAGGNTLSSANAYWSSTEKDASSAWIVDSSLKFASSSKTSNNSVRAIHDFGGGQTIVYDTALYYYWNTGTTTPFIEVSPTQTTTYTVTAVTEFGCSATAEQTVYVNPSGTEHVYDTVCAGYAYEGYGFALTPEQTQTQGEASFSREIGGGECSATLTLHLYKRGSVAGPVINASTCENEAYYYNGYAYSVAGTYHQVYTAAMGCDSIVTINLSVLPVSSRTIERETCNSLTWNGEVYTESGTYEQTLQNQHGCDSVVTMYLTVNRDITRIINDTTCGAYTWNGHVYTESGQYTETFEASTGCDSIVTLNLTVNGVLESEWEHQACEAFTWNGMEYTETGDYEQTFEASTGCDSIVTLHLTINDIINEEQTQESCGAYIWNDTTYYATGDYTQTFESMHGCDSIVTLHLTINDIINEEQTQESCGAYVWNDTTYTATGDYTQTFESVHGCDSIVILHLTIHPMDTTSLFVTTCDEYEWYGNSYTEPGIYEHLLQSAAGCDSLLVLDLSIGESFTMEYAESACNSYSWRGNTYFESGIYQDTVPSPDGCDSLFVLNLDLGFDMMIDTSATACSAFVWNGTEYTATGDYEQTFESVQGCDSIVTLHLTINDVLTNEWEHQACNSYVWNGMEYTATGDYEQTFESILGCDSIVTLHLTINDVLTSEWEHQACNSFVWNGTEYTATGDYEQTFESVQGCDSIVTLHLELVNMYDVYLDTVHCGAYWFNGQEIETSGYYEGQFVSTDGCDSIVHLQLTVGHFPDVPIMEGQENVFVATDLVTGIYHYEAEPVPNATHYEWSLTGADWLMDTIGTSCMLMVIYPGTGILTLRAWNECGYTEVQKVINAGFFDVGEQEAVMVNVYPNPAKNKAVVESEGIMRIRMYSMKGQLLQEINGNGDDRVEVNLRDFAPAPYLLEVMTRNGVANVKLNVVR